MIKECSQFPTNSQFSTNTEVPNYLLLYFSCENDSLFNKRTLSRVMMHHAKTAAF